MCGQPPPQPVLADCLLEQNPGVREFDFLYFLPVKYNVGLCAGKNLVIHSFCLFGSWLNRNLHYLTSGFFLGNQNKFPIQLLSTFQSLMILLFSLVGFSLVEAA